MKEKDDLLREIGDRIRKARLAADLQQVQVSQEFRCAQSKISSIEKGTRDPGSDFYAWFAKRTGCSLDQIILGNEYKRSIAKERTSSNNEVKNAVKPLIEALFQSGEIQKYMEEKIGDPDMFSSIQVELTDSERIIFFALRAMSSERFNEVYEYIITPPK